MVLTTHMRSCNLLDLFCSSIEMRGCRDGKKQLFCILQKQQYSIEDISILKFMVISCLANICNFRMNYNLVLLVLTQLKNTSTLFTTAFLPFLEYDTHSEVWKIKSDSAFDFVIKEI